MSRIDELKEEIGWLKIVFAILVATEISLLAWLGQNYANASVVLIVCAVAIAIVLGMGIISINRRAYRKMDELGDS